MNEWSKEPESFECKSFEDRESLVSVNFVYKDGDKDFEASNLEASISKAKKLNLFK